MAIGLGLTPLTVKKKKKKKKSAITSIDDNSKSTCPRRGREVPRERQIEHRRKIQKS
jgi:hypothetical protein